MRRLTALALLALAACAPPEAPTPQVTYRVLGGLSMGAIGTGALGFAHPEKFDALASMGGPLDAALLLRTIDRFHLGGFCSAADLDGIPPAQLNDPVAVSGCIHPPERITWEHAQDFNHLKYTVNTPFDRGGYIGLFNDLTLAFGNLLTENPVSKFAPPGVDEARARKPPSDFCTNPVRVKKLYNREHNPDGVVDAITFCDGEPVLWYCNFGLEKVDFCSNPANKLTPLPKSQEAAFANAYCAAKGGADFGDRMKTPALALQWGGQLDPCRERTLPVRVALAFDLNGNGRRDYGEPVVNNGEERYRDVGTDGCADADESGDGKCNGLGDPALAVDLNHDNYDAEENPFGLEANWRHDEGEPFDDDGLDGVPGTKDVGEGNGRFDMTSGRRALYGQDPRTQLAALLPPITGHLRLLLDGGIRDLFNFGLTARQVWGAWRRRAETELYRDWTEIPGMKDTRTGNYRPWGGPWGRAPKNFAVLYGKEEPTLDDRILGDGDHVGTNGQAVNRIATLYNFTGAQWPSLPRPVSPLGGTPYDERELIRVYDSKALGAKRDYGVFLPPGYELPENAQTRYPVLFLLHGYTGTPKQILPSAFLADTFMKDSDIGLRPMIIVTPSGACCFRHTSGARECREVDDAGAPYLGKAGWERECEGGSFFVDHQAGAPGTVGNYGTAVLELMEEIDRNYRTLPAARTAR
jgi:hypothetical protein